MSQNESPSNTVADKLSEDNLWKYPQSAALSEALADLQFLAADTHEVMRVQGFHDTDRKLRWLVDNHAAEADVGELQKSLNAVLRLSRHALIVTEVAECTEGVRKPGPSDHCPELTAEEEEIADVVVRILDYCGAYNIDLGRALAAKMRFNMQRPYRHGGKLA